MGRSCRPRCVRVRAGGLRLSPALGAWRCGGRGRQASAVSGEARPTCTGRVPPADMCLPSPSSFLPPQVTIRLLQHAMTSSGATRFLIDGFPRNEENRSNFEALVSLLVVNDVIPLYRLCIFLSFFPLCCVFLCALPVASVQPCGRRGRPTHSTASPVPSALSRLAWSPNSCSSSSAARR